MTRCVKKISGDLINGMQMCCLRLFIKSLGNTPEERERILAGMDEAIARDIQEHYARPSGEDMEPDAGITEDEWLRKAMEMGVRDVR